MWMKILMITLLTVFVIDISGIVESIESALSRWLNGKAKVPKPFNCSLCMTWWLGIIYLLCLSQFTLFNICIVALFAYLSGVIATLLIFVKELLMNIIERLYNALN